MELAYHISDFVWQIDIYPNLVAVIGNKKVMEELKKLLKVKSNNPVVLGYDTTFNLGDYYVSPLVFRHLLFNSEPVIPVAFVIHERKFEKVHERFFEIFAQQVPEIRNAAIPIIVDREKGITVAINKICQEATVVYCWNHVRRDMRLWIRQKTGATAEEISVYSDGLLSILDAESEEDFEEIVEKITAKWSQPVVDYFEKEMKEDIKSHAAKFIIEPLGLFDPYSGVTNNCSESLNAVIKDLLDWHEVPVDVIFLSLHKLQSYYHREILRGLASVGNYRLKPEFVNAARNIDEIVIQDTIVDPGEIVKSIREAIEEKESHNTFEDLVCETNNEDNRMKKVVAGDQESRENLHIDNVTEDLHEETSIGDKSKLLTDGNGHGKSLNDDVSRNQTAGLLDKSRMSQTALAKDLIKEGNIVHVPSMGSFMVEGSGGRKYAVSLFPKAVCQCPSTSTCYHILAAQMSVGLKTDDTKICNLTQLRKRARKRSDKKSGRKKPRLGDLDVEVVAAPDSKENEVLDTNASSFGGLGRSSSLFLGLQSLSASGSQDNVIEIGSKEASGAAGNPSSKFAILDHPKSQSLNDNNIKVDQTVKSSDQKEKKEIGIKSIDKKKNMWLSKLNLTSDHKAQIMIDDGWLEDDVINASIKIIKKFYPNINGLQNTLLIPNYDAKKKIWNYNIKFKKQPPPSVQIHYTGRSRHWVTSFQTDKDSPIYILDSLFMGITTNLEIQLATIYGQGKDKLDIKISTKNKQPNSADCGVYAVANAIECCEGGFGDIGNSNWTFDYLNDMRKHLVFCLEDQKLTGFPKIEEKLSTKETMIEHTIEMNCPCGLPNSMENMLGCDSCGRWFHESCSNIETTDFDKSFCCQFCKGK